MVRVALRLVVSRAMAGPPEVAAQPMAGVEGRRTTAGQDVSRDRACQTLK